MLFESASYASVYVRLSIVAVAKWESVLVDLDRACRQRSVLPRELPVSLFVVLWHFGVAGNASFVF